MDHSLPRANSANFAWHFVRFRGSPWQITVNSIVNSQLRVNQLCCSKYLTRKRGNCECNVTWGRPTPCQSFSALIKGHAKSEVAEPIHCRILAFMLLIHYFTLWPWPLTSDCEHLQCIACDVNETMYQILMQSSNPWLWMNGLLHIAARCWTVHETLKHSNKNIQHKITVQL